MNKVLNSVPSIRGAWSTGNEGVEVQDAKNLLAVNFVFLNALNQASLSLSGVNLGVFSEATVWLSILTLGLDLGDNFDLALEVVVITTVILLWLHYSVFVNSASLRHSDFFSSDRIFYGFSILIISTSIGFFTATVRNSLEVETFIVLGSVLTASAGYFMVFFGFNILFKQFSQTVRHTELLAFERWVIEVAILLVLPTLAGIAAGYFDDEADRGGTEIIALGLSILYCLIVLVLSVSLTVELKEDIRIKPFFWGFFVQPDLKTLYWFIYRSIFLAPLLSDPLSIMKYSPAHWPFKNWTFFIVPLLMVEKIIVAVSSRLLQEDDEITLLVISAGVYSSMIVPFLCCRFTSKDMRNGFDYNLELGVRVSTVVAICLAIGSQQTENKKLITALEIFIGLIYILLALFWIYLIKKYGIFSQVYNSVYFSLEKPLQQQHYENNEIEYCVKILDAPAAYDQNRLKYNLWRMFSPAQRLYFLVNRSNIHQNEIANIGQGEATRETSDKVCFIDPNQTNLFLVKPWLDRRSDFSRLAALTLSGMEFPIGLWQSMSITEGAFKALKQLFLHKCKFQLQTYDAFINYLKMNKNFQTISFSNCNLSPDMITMLADPLKQQKQLFHLSVTGINALGGEVPIESLIDAVSSLENLSELFFVGCPFKVNLVLTALRKLLIVRKEKKGIAVHIALGVTSSLGVLQATDEDLTILFDIALFAIQDQPILRMFDFDFMERINYYNRDELDQKLIFQKVWLHIQCIVLAYNNYFRISLSNSRYKLRRYLWADNLLNRKIKDIGREKDRWTILGLYIVAGYGFNKDWITRMRVKSMFKKHLSNIDDLQFEFLRAMETDDVEVCTETNEVLIYKNNEFMTKTRQFWDIGNMEEWLTKKSINVGKTEKKKKNTPNVVDGML